MPHRFLQALANVSESGLRSHPRFTSRLAFQLGLHKSSSLPSLAQQPIKSFSPLSSILERQPQRGQKVLQQTNFLAMLSRMAQKMGMPKAMITILEPNMQVQARWSTTPLIKI
jgi:hypothetical protein